MHRKSFLILYLAFGVIVLLVQYLAGLPLIPVFYSLLILTFLTLTYLIVDYIRFLSKLKYLQDVYEHLSVDKHLFLQPDNPVEDQYQKIISSLYDIIREHENTLAKNHTEQVEYYTMWVHQIKTPISAMRLALQNCSTNGRDELLEQELFKIEQYVELALHYTKIEDLSTDLVIREYPLHEIVNQSIRKYAALFIFKKLTVQIKEFHAVVTTDSKWLSFILEQLISNAIKYTNSGGIEISFEQNSLIIKDTGIGIRAEDIERIFEKGYTGYNGRVDKKASGIGLYLTKKVADSLSIKLIVTSELGKGTTAIVSFPEASYYE